MNAPRRWVDDPDADESLRDVLRQAPAARALDSATRRRLGGKVARASAVPLVAAGWLFVKSASAALVVVLGTGTVMIATGVVDWPSSHPAPAGSTPEKPRPVPASAKALPATPVAEQPAPEAAPSAPVAAPAPVASAPPDASARTLAAEAALLEQARREMRRDAAMALAITDEHRVRFPKGQLASERLLIQIEALHRLHRDEEARAIANRLLGGANAGLYTERVRALLGEGAAR